MGCPTAFWARCVFHSAISANFMRSSSPTRIRTWISAVNGRLPYQLGDRGKQYQERVARIGLAVSSMARKRSSVELYPQIPVGMDGFEPSTPGFRRQRAARTALHSEVSPS
jgi:hypothetical protein